MMKSFTLLLFFIPALTLPAPAQVSPSQEGVGGVLASSIPLPRQNPRRANKLPSSKASPAAAWPAGKSGFSAPAIADARAACASSLQGRDIAYDRAAPIGNDSGCGIAAPISVSRAAGIALDPPAVINCAAAAALHDWLVQSVQPAAQRRLKTQVTQIHVAASYVCRRRNNARSGKLSEHAKGNAVDMSGFSFAQKESVAVEGAGWGSGLLRTIGLSKDGSFLGDIRKGACTHFTTVLGPGSDRYHGDHFHVDVIQRRGGYRICK
jgi:hypothetical protein